MPEISCDYSVIMPPCNASAKCRWCKIAGYISGLGNNIFGPSPVAGKDANYGKATREQAFKIAVAMIEKFK